MKKLLKAILPATFLALIKSTRNSIRSFFHISAKNYMNKINFEIHLAEHCNLNCAGCNHFSSIAEPELVDIQEFTKDMERMGALFNHECGRIFLIGGEPLLHPEIITLMKIARGNFPEGDISIYTNGILLSKKDAAFWQACHDNKIKILISTYPIDIDIDTIERRAREFDVCISWSSAPKEALSASSFIVSPIDLSGHGDIGKSFNACFESNGCVTLKHGRLFTCVFAAHVHHFNKRFGTNIQITEADYINIYDDIDGKSILKKLNRPIPACKYCSGGRFTKSARRIPWHHTEYNINEWL